MSSILNPNKKVEIVSGDGSNLNISPVTDYIDTDDKKSKNKPKNIVVPKESDKK